MLQSINDTSNEPPSIQMTRENRRLYKLGFWILLTISLFLFLYAADLIPFTGEKDIDDEDVLLPPLEKLGKYSHRQLAELYHRYINTVQLLCHRIVRIGNIEDGGWEICEDKEFRPTPPCLVYSFGINNDFSFDDQIADRYNCEVHSFDPSMNMKEGQRKHKQWFHRVGLSDRSETLANGWRVSTLQDLMNIQQHSGIKIDILKIDVEKYEWGALRQIFESGGLKNIRQLVIELHSAIVGEPSEHEYLLALGILKHLYEAGFRIVYSHRNLWCKFLSQFEGIDEGARFKLDINNSAIVTIYTERIKKRRVNFKPGIKYDIGLYFK